ncbi:glycosyltransferase family 61 protein [Pseudodesulfovibrio sediminis]|uniref:Glycosyltransferase 61 catalytic domain-containing protein n=1 Tax=Pseudodesulfovibrio sediminis TaxID=2810563 RepID=A0ABM7P629_9BACT|nr:glycosyltransferase family 61 protein [Pseudodesulfovibrio sediminis]BCS88388.1 hypothetical protein PSDVSF_16300 [Pseudodesulfovibrio sediminis]
MIENLPDIQSLLNRVDRTGEGVVVELEKGKYVPIDSDRFFSNVPTSLFASTVCKNTRGKFFSPPRRVYRLYNAVMSPLVRRPGRWPEIMYIHSSEGRLLHDLLQRSEDSSRLPYEYVNPVRMGGACVYLGMLMPYFGHFLSEVVSRFWLSDELRGRDVKYVFHATPASIAAWDTDTRSTRFVESIMNLFGIDRSQIHFITEDTVFDDVICPTALNWYTQGYHPEYVAIADRIRDAFIDTSAQTPKRIFLSRSRFKGRNLINAAQIEALFAGHGFEIIHPQEHSFGEQVAMVAGAEVIAGEEGSAFCNVMFSNKPVIIELESGRFHQNLPRLSYMMSQAYCFILPYLNGKMIPGVGMKTRLYANPWAVDETLAVLFDSKPLGEAVCGPKECARLYEHAFIASQSADPERWVKIMRTVLSEYPDNFSPDMLTGLVQNFEQCKATPSVINQLAKETLALLKEFGASGRD